MNRTLQQVFGVFAKEWKLMIRFRTAIIPKIVRPFMWVITPFLIYSVSFKAGYKDLGDLNEDNVLAFLAIGIVLYDIAAKMFEAFDMKEEKYWKTLEGMLMAPMSRLTYFIGKSLFVMSFFLVSDLPMLVTVVYISGASLNLLFFLIFAIFATWLIWMGVGIVMSGISLFSEGIYTLFLLYGLWIVSIVSGVFFPPDILPDILVYIGKIIPLYHAISVARAPLIHASVQLSSVIYLLSFSIVMPILGVYLFNEMYKRKGIVGY